MKSEWGERERESTQKNNGMTKECEGKRQCGGNVESLKKKSVLFLNGQ